MDSAFDPRTRVTPDAFQVSERVLGWPLASPGRRLVAVLIDLVVVGILTLMGWRVLGVLAATGFVWLAFGGGNPPTSFGRRALRWSGGCLGALTVFVLVVTSGELLQWVLRQFEDDDRPAVEAVGEPGRASNLRAALGGLGNLRAFRSASSAEEAERFAASLVREGADLGMTPDEVAELLRETAPADVAWDPFEVIDRALLDVREAPEPAPSDMALPDAFAEYRTLLSTPDSLVDAERRRHVARVIVAEVGSDSLRALNDRIAAMDASLDDESARRAAVEEELEDAREGGLFSWILNTVDQLGLTFGWGALYFAFLLTMFDGLTPGKKAAGIRVQRLDGEPMTWLLAFERSGGYAAGFATGLLGFAQILWDDNRQAIHDRIAGTVVVQDVRSVRPGPGGPTRSTG